MKVTNKQSKLILLIGLGRSGTTWIGKIFDSHPDTYYMHEPDNWCKKIPLPTITNPTTNIPDTLGMYLDSLIEIKNSQIVGKLPAFPKSYHGLFVNRIRTLNINLSKVAAKFSIRIPIFNYNLKNKLSNSRLVWKSIESLGRLDYFTKSSENIHIIHIIRHPCGFISSVLRGEKVGVFDSDCATSEDFGVFDLLSKTEQAQAHGISLQTFKEMTSLERLAWKWVLVNEKALVEGKLHNQTMLLKYEDLCANPIEVAKQLFEYCGLNWNIQSENFLSKSTNTNKTQYYSVFKDPKQAASKWKNELSPTDINTIMSIVAKSKFADLYSE